MPATLWQDDPKTKARLYDVEGVRVWRAAQPKRGRPTAIDVLTREELGAQPSTDTTTGEAASSVATRDDLSEEDLAALRAVGMDEDAIARTGLSPKLLKRAGAAAKVRKDEADAMKKELDNLERSSQLVHIDSVRQVFQVQSSMVLNSQTWFPGAVASGVRERARKVAEDLPQENRDAFLGLVYDATHEVTGEEFHALLSRFSLEAPQ